MLTIFLAFAIAAFLLAALLKRRHRPQLLTTCLALSILLHLISLSLFNVVRVQTGRLEPRTPPMPGAHRIELGSSVFRESRVTHNIRNEPLKTEAVDAHTLLEAVRAKRREPVRKEPVIAQASPREADARTAGRVEIKTPALAPPKRALDEPLDAVPNSQIELSSIKIAPLQQPRRATESVKNNQGAIEKQFDITPPTPAVALTRPEVKPGAPLKTASQTPARETIMLAAAASRQPEVRDAIQPAQARATLDRLTDRAAQIENPRAPATADLPAGARPGMEVNTGKQVGDAPQPTGKRMTAAQRAERTRMASDSLATKSSGSIERKKNEVGGFSTQPAANASRLEPLRLSDVQTLVVAGRAGAQEPIKASGGQREWTAAKDKSAVSGGLEPTAGKPQAQVRDIAPSKNPIQVGLGVGTPSGPASKIPSVQDGVSDLPAERPGLVAIGGPVPAMALAQGNLRSAAPAADSVGPSDLAAGKKVGGLGSAQTSARVAPNHFSGSRDHGVASGTLVEGTGGGMLQSRTSSSSDVNEQLAGAQTGGANAGGQGFADMGAPAQSVAVASRGVSAEGGQGLKPVAIALGRATPSGASAGSGKVARPSPAGRSTSVATEHDSFVRPDAVGSGSVAGGRSVSGSEQVETGTSAALANDAARDLTGRMNIERSPFESASAGGTGNGGGGGEQTELSPGRAGGGNVADAGVALQRFQAPGEAGGSVATDPAGTLMVASTLQSSTTASGTAATESLAAMNTSASASDSGGPAIMAPPIARPTSSGGSTAEAGIAPAGSLQVAKAKTGDSLVAGQTGGGGRGNMTAAVDGAGERAPALLDMSLNAGQPKARETSDISSAEPGQEGFHSFLTVGNAPNPAFVPQKAIYKMRKPEKRKQFIKELGGTAQTEEAVEQALTWLDGAQSDDGRWDVDGFKTLKQCGGAGDLANEDMVVTGMSLLAFLGAGYTHIDGAHKEAVRKGLDWLLNCEKENGDFREAGQMYGQAIATAALCESYSLTGDKRLLAPARRAVKFIVDSQTSESGWRYAPSDENDTSVTGWQILALKSAQIAGIAVPEQTFRWTELWLDKVRQGKAGGLYSYKVGHVVTPVMTAEGAFCQLFTGEQTKTLGIDESIAYLMNNQPAWNPQNRSVHMYYWYYATMAMYLSGAQEFKAWNSALTSALLKGRSTTGPAVGSWDPVCILGPRGGRIYSTAAGALCLEVYYRFLPLYRQKEL